MPHFLPKKEKEEKDFFKVVLEIVTEFEIFCLNTSFVATLLKEIGTLDRNQMTQ